MIKDKPSQLSDGSYVMAVWSPCGALVSVNADTKQHCIVAGREIRKGLLVSGEEAAA